MAVLLNKGYAGYLAGTVVNLPTSVETALIAQGLAIASVVASTTPGAVTANVPSGIGAVAIGAATLVITNNLVDANTPVSACIAQAAADATALRVERIVTTAGVITIHVTANATAATLVRWSINPTGLTATN